MNNDIFLDEMRNNYESLKYFTLKDNKLVLTYNNLTYMIPFTHVSLYLLNKNIFLLSPIELFQTLYVLELFYRDELTGEEEKFVTDFTQKYLELNRTLLANQNNDQQRINGLNVPIYTSYNVNYTDTACAQVIKKVIKNYNDNIEAGKIKGQKLVLEDNSLFNIYDDNNYHYLEQAGYATIFLIVTSVILTSLYIIFFIVK